MTDQKIDIGDIVTGIFRQHGKPLRISGYVADLEDDRIGFGVLDPVSRSSLDERRQLGKDDYPVTVYMLRRNMVDYLIHRKYNEPKP